MVNYARRMKNMESTANIIRGLFGAMSNPDIISFGGGAVAREALPVEQIRKITYDLLDPAGRGVEVLS